MSEGKNAIRPESAIPADFARCIRDPYWDTLKFVLVFLVALGHFIHAPMGKCAYAFSRTIYFFHIPLFVFVSGRFSRIHDRHRYREGICRLLETFLFFHVVSAVPTMLVRGGTWLTCLTTPASTYWYLLALVYWRVGVAFLSRGQPDGTECPRSMPLRRAAGIVAGCAGIALLAGFLPVSEEFTVQRALAFLPFFVAGYVTADQDVVVSVRRIPVFAAVAGLLSVFVFLLVFLPDADLSFVTHGKYSYWHAGGGIWWDASAGSLASAFAKMGLRAIGLLGAAVTGLLAMRLVAANIVVARWGRATLVVYVYHRFFCNAAKILENAHVLPTGVGAWAVEAAVTVCLLAFLARFRVMRFLLNPASNLRAFFRKRKEGPTGGMQASSDAGE